MTSTAEAAKIKSLKKAREQHEAAKTEALALLEIIKNRIARSNPQELHWGHTGDMLHNLSEIKELEAQTRRHS